MVNIVGGGKEEFVNEHSTFETSDPLSSFFIQVGGAMALGYIGQSL